MTTQRHSFNIFSPASYLRDLERGLIALSAIYLVIVGYYQDLIIPSAIVSALLIAASIPRVIPVRGRNTATLLRVTLLQIGAWLLVIISRDPGSGFRLLLFLSPVFLPLGEDESTVRYIMMTISVLLLMAFLPLYNSPLNIAGTMWYISLMVFGTVFIGIMKDHFLATLHTTDEQQKRLQAEEARWRAITELISDYAFAIRVYWDGEPPPPDFPSSPPPHLHELTGFYQEVEWITEQSFKAISGYDHDDIQNTVIVHPDDQPNYRERLYNIVIKGQENTSEYRIIRKDGDIRWLRAYARPQFDEDGRVIRFVGASQDVTIQKETEQSERDQRLFAEALLDSLKAINSSLELSEVLDRVMQNVHRVLPSDATTIFIIDGEEAYTAHAHGYEERGLGEYVMSMRFNIKTTPNLRQMLETGQPVMYPDVHKEPGWKAKEPLGWVRSYLGVPIISQNEPLGFINMDMAEPNAFTGEMANRLMAFADQVGIAIRNARMYRTQQSRTASLQAAIAAQTMELRRAKERTDTILNSSPDVILMLNQHGQIESANLAFSTILGYDHADSFVHKLPGTLADGYATSQVNRSVQKAIAEQDNVRFETRLNRRDGTTIDVDFAIAPVFADRKRARLVGLVCSIRDISAMKEVERMKDAFVSGVSHELRTPITSLKLYHTLLRQNPIKKDIYLERLDRETRRLEAIVEGVLMLSRLDQHRRAAEVQPIDLGQLLLNFIEDRKPLAASRGLALKLETGRQLHRAYADASLLTQAISVLVTNAINYTPEGGQIRVRLNEEQGERFPEAIISVADNGPGIKPEEYEQIFTRFYRGSAAVNSGVAGTGLGLALALEIMNLHGGSIEIEPTGLDGAGVTFHLRLPLDEKTVRYFIGAEPGTAT